MRPLGFIHNIDPVLAEIGTVRLYYYGLMYALGFLGIHFWLLARRKALGWRISEVYDFSIGFILGVLVIGRALSVLIYQWSYYRERPEELLSYWRGGMASHGVLFGALLAGMVFCVWRKKDFWRVADEVAIPAAFFLGCGRLGNFINGEIYGYETNVWWAVKFPEVDGFRHPVTLYEGLKNFAIIAVLLLARRRTTPGRGVLFAHLVLWYGLLRFVTDLFREYEVHFLGLGRGQWFNLLMAAAGAGLLVWRLRIEPQSKADLCAADRGNASAQAPPVESATSASPWLLWVRRALLVGLVGFALVIRSGWTVGVEKELHDRNIEAPSPAQISQSTQR